MKISTRTALSCRGAARDALAGQARTAGGRSQFLLASCSRLTFFERGASRQQPKAAAHRPSNRPRLSQVSTAPGLSTPRSRPRGPLPYHCERARSCEGSRDALGARQRWKQKRGRKKKKARLRFFSSSSSFFSAFITLFPFLFTGAETFDNKTNHAGHHLDRR